MAARTTLVSPGRHVIESAQETAAFQHRAKKAAAEYLHVLAEIASGEFRSETVTETFGKDGELVHRQVTTSKPTAKDRAGAIADLVKYGRLPVGPAPEAGQGGTVDPRALFAALADPAVRKYLEVTYPELAQRLRLLSAIPAEDATVTGET